MSAERIQPATILTLRGPNAPAFSSAAPGTTGDSPLAERDATTLNQEAHQ